MALLDLRPPVPVGRPVGIGSHLDLLVVSATFRAPHGKMRKLEGFVCVVKAPLPKVPTMDRVNARVGSKRFGLRGETARSQATSVLLYLSNYRAQIRNVIPELYF